MSKSPLLLLAAVLLVGCLPAQGGQTAASTPDPQPWWREAVFYEIFVRSFYDTNGDGIGDLNGVREKLGYLSELGVNAIWLMPINPSPSYHGYDVTDYYGINPQYGTLGDFKQLLAEAHKRGMHVIMDLVINHTSNQHPHFRDAAARGPQSEYYGWYVWSDTNQGRFWYPVPGQTSRHYFALFCDCMPDLNYRNPEVTAETEKISSFWLNEVGVDGFRLDAAKHFIEDGNIIENTPETHTWLKGFHEFYTAHKPGAYVVGEVGGADASQVKAYASDQVDQIFNFELARDFLDGSKSGTSSALNSGLTFADQATPNGNYATFLSNHDQNRTMSVVGGDVNKARLAAFLLLTSPGTPYIYYGEEIGMQGQKPDEDIRRPMQWDADRAAGFTTGEPWRAPAEDFEAVNVVNEAREPGSLLGSYRKLVATRRQHVSLSMGQLTLVNTESLALFSALRMEGNDRLLVLANLSSQPITQYGLSISGSQPSLPGGDYTLTGIFGQGQFTALQVSGDGRFDNFKPLPQIPAYGMYILELTKR